MRLIPSLFLTVAIFCLGGCVWDNIPVSAAPTNTACLGPLYRSYHSKGPDHFYTTNASESETALKYGWAKEGQAGTVALANNCACGDGVQLIPVFRMYNKAVNDHFYTQNATERDGPTAANYASEGTAFFCADAVNKCGATKPLYRYLHAKTDHFYTTNHTEGDECVKAGRCKDEGITCHIW